MAASAAMIVLAVWTPLAHAQDAAQTAAANMVLLNKIQGLQSQMRQMQGQIEDLQHQLQVLQRTSKDQYIALDSRVGRLEKAQQAPAAGAASGASSPATSAVAKAAPGTSAAAATAKPETAADKAAAHAAYQAAFKSLRAGNYVASAQGFREFIAKYPDSTLVSNAYYWLGGSYYVTQNYKPALVAFQTLLQKYPKSPKLADAQLRVADCEVGLKDYKAARSTLQAVIKAHPGTSVERRARDRLQNLPPATSAK
ncbi:MAG TPA: tol-pal system protein YbgF [Rhodanobacteraceae bacterium]